ncbi:Sac3p KNAG_0A05060 [Huiozyma naganishii CBS 8797]|uniref:Nuclear mRNA export factor n=1 Tax=Huiozyma naganishii (strain ATCC MYA-139 / BCRC 22969 / CBS 8797 / KCTC 17520 / NBRC 10181 / NCYC 3082 / Yp74L-3) TaxID=1071383 RepID=J7RF36_HUIN7|nr:hypothetical protein KNAG_0A05060 [Kazachstania naganishii CBS 8797]CCK68173.1 hypothetical protein KNAG_0A05060 [Kazachstania naganishii CBS 8797]
MSGTTGSNDRARHANTGDKGNKFLKKRQNTRKRGVSPPKLNPFRTGVSSGDHSLPRKPVVNATPADAPKKQQATINKNVNLGPLVSDPATFGFKPLQHVERSLPRFLLTQQPQLRPRKFVQDHWDKLNQHKMEKLEESIEDLNELYETLKKMREVERLMMERKGLVDKADLAKDLNDAIVFQGTCLDMCPVFERARRNVEYTVFSYEKETPDHKKASRNKALKVFARPAAAAAPPLPSDVRPPHVLVKTMDYIVNNILDTLPKSEGFIWDRMRSIRQDFTFQNYAGPEAIDCNERIVRVHLLILHIMVKTNSEFSLQQELEQLHKSLITLAEIYDDVRANGGSCPNEAEFRAYGLLSKMRDPQYDQTIQELPTEIFQDHLVQLALCFRKIVSNSNFKERGYIRTENCLNFYLRFFQLITSPKVPFLMSAFLQTYLGEIRFYTVKALANSLNKKHKPIPFDNLIEIMAFNNEQELTDFCNYYSIELIDKTVDVRSLTHFSHRLPETQPLKQTYLKSVDDKMRAFSYQQIINSGKPNLDSLPELGIEPVIINMGQSLGTNTNDQPAPQNSKVPIFDLRNKATQLPAQFPSSVPPQKFGNLPTTTTKNTPNDKSQLLFPAASEPIETGPPKQTNTSSNTMFPTFKLNNNRNEQFAATQPVRTNTPSISTKQSSLSFSTIQKPGAKTTAPGVKTESNLGEDTVQLPNSVALETANTIISEVVHGRCSSITKQCMKENQNETKVIDSLSEELFQAFMREKMYTIYGECKADNYRIQTLFKENFKTWKNHFEERKKHRELQRTRKQEIKSVQQQLGVPNWSKTRKVWDTPRKDRDNSFLLSSDKKRGVMFSPVDNERNAFSTQLNNKNELWNPYNLKEMYLTPVLSKVSPSVQNVTFSILLYGDRWTSIPNRWVLNKFNIIDPSLPLVLRERNVALEVKCIDNSYDSETLENTQLIVFNTGVTHSDIFDLEMKLQKDGEELIKLITKVSMNTKFCFNLLMIYWESSKTAIASSKISKYLKLSRIERSFNSVLLNIGFVSISDLSPHKVLENGLRRMAGDFEYKLSARGKCQEIVQRKRTLTGTLLQHKQELSSLENFDEKMKRILESENDKYRQHQNSKNTYARLQSHIMASPRAKKKKLPVLLSESKKHTNKFRTPSGGRFPVPGSSPMSSHLAMKVQKADQTLAIEQVLPVRTPSHSTNVPTTSMIAYHTTPTVDTHGHSKVLSNGLFVPGDKSSTIYQTPLPVSNQLNRNLSTASEDEVHDIQELKGLIQTVRKRIQNTQ